MPVSPQQVRRTCQQEATSCAVPIDDPLYGAEQTWLASGGIEHVEVVQRAVEPFAWNELLGQGARWAADGVVSC
jgi:hypothetical protein